MNNKIPFTFWLTCEHCKNKAVLFTDFNQKESKCANGMTCGKVSKLNENEKLSFYLDFLEEGRIQSNINYQSLLKENEELKNKSFLVKTKSGGTRLINNNFNSIQWAMTERIEDLV